ncbi:PREDICTED: mas-related G-protein coupled receptor member H-like [Ficedula albicollis]|uniref:mas-related G-protein coupled receptor member H-like n=1 Tax=Ficedula albicollis TaxID=59894 RepID=UPI0007AD7E71|nr:PREDICTED: mas-related G-protein coupled receptor member H-like [Ficedula albicollis]
MELSLTSPPPSSPVTGSQGDDSCGINVTDVTIDGVTLFICLCGLIGNGAVLWLLGFHIRRNPITVYILNLAVADFTFIVFMVASFVIRLLYDVSCSNVVSVTHLICLLLLTLFSYNMGLYLLTAISIERCSSILFPLWYRCRRPQHLSWVVCALLWALSIAVMVVVTASLSCLSSRSHQERGEGVGAAVDAGEQQNNLGGHNDVTELLQEMAEAEWEGKEEEKEHNASCSIVVSQMLLRSLLLLSLFSYNMGLYLLTAISIERCSSILFPLWYRCRRPQHLSWVVCALLWALSIAVMVVVTSLCLLKDEEHCQVALISMYALNFLIFAPPMVISNVILFIKVLCGSKRRQPKRLYIVIFLTVLFFLIFGVPLSLWSFLQLLDYIFKHNHVFFLLACINSWGEGHDG